MGLDVRVSPSILSYQKEQTIRRSNKKHQKRSSVKRPVLSLYEILEPRVLLNGYTFTIADQGSDTANGTYPKTCSTAARS